MPDLIFDLYTLFGPVPPRGGDTDPSHLQELLQKHGIAGAVTLSTRGLHYSASAGNRETIHYCTEIGPSLLPGVVLDPRQPQVVGTLAGARAYFLLHNTQQWPVHYAPLVDLLQMRAVRVNTWPRPLPLWWEARNHGDATAIYELMKQVDYPAPYILGSVNGDGLVEAIAVGRRDENVLVATDGLRGIGEVAMLVQALGAHRVVFGSGAPAQSLGSALALVRQAGLSPSEETMVLSGNAIRILSRKAVENPATAQKLPNP